MAQLPSLPPAQVLQRQETHPEPVGGGVLQSPRWPLRGCPEGHVGGLEDPQIPPRTLGVRKGKVGPTTKVVVADRCFV